MHQGMSTTVISAPKIHSLIGLGILATARYFPLIPLSQLNQLCQPFEEVLSSCVGAQVNPAQGWGNVSNLHFSKADTETLLIQLDQADVIASDCSSPHSWIDGAISRLNSHASTQALQVQHASFASSSMNALEEIEKADQLIEKVLVAQSTW